MYKIINKTFQPMQIVIGPNETYLLKARTKNKSLHLKYINKQIENLYEKGLIKLKKIN